MCDTLCALNDGGALFGKNSDRPPVEVQVVEAHPRRPGGGAVRTQYLAIPDAGAAALMGSRPAWLWGFEHGVNEHRVAIGNEKVVTIQDPYAEPEALIGMDLVRLGLERGRTAGEALDAITSLLEAHGQGGLCNNVVREPYFSSFLIADPNGGWVLETSARTWVARPVGEGAAISNRLTIRREWTRASKDVPPGADFDSWRNPLAPTGLADGRLSASLACLARGASALTPRDFAAHLRDHGQGPWGAPGGPEDRVDPPPPYVLPDGTGVSICMHVRGFQNTTSSMIAELPKDPEAPMRAWVALGSPCASIYVPVFPPHAVPEGLASPVAWCRFAALRDWVEADAGALHHVRRLFGPLEAALWAEADEVARDRAQQRPWVDEAWARVLEALSLATRLALQA